MSIDLGSVGLAILLITVVCYARKLVYWQSAPHGTFTPGQGLGSENYLGCVRWRRRSSAWRNKQAFDRYIQVNRYKALRRLRK